MLSESPVREEKRLSLFEHEDELAQLEQLISQDGTEGALVEAHEWVKSATIHKRERVAQYIRDAKDRLTLGRQMLKKRTVEAKAFLDTREREIERLEAYFAAGIKAMGRDAKGKYPILRGLTTQMRIQKHPDALKITDEVQVPARFKTITVTMPTESWFAIASALEDNVLRSIYLNGSAIDKEAVKRALDNNEDVPGAEITPGGMGLRFD